MNFFARVAIFTVGNSVVLTIDDGDCGSSVGALVDSDIREVSTVFDAIFLYGAIQLGGDENAQIISEGQRTVVVAAVARTDGTLVTS